MNKESDEAKSYEKKDLYCRIERRRIYKPKDSSVRVTMSESKKFELHSPPWSVQGSGKKSNGRGWLSPATKRRSKHEPET
jgi:hypothetical protein